MVGVTVVVLSDVGAARVVASGPTPEVASAPAGIRSRTAEDAPARGMPDQAPPAITPSLLSVTSTTTDRPTVALTFDDGPTAAYTPAVLDILAEHRVQATFCMIDSQAVAEPALVQRVVAAGHRLCDHTFTHDTTIGAGDEGPMGAQLGRSRRSLATVVIPAAPVDYFRAPEGKWSPQHDQVAARTGMRPLGWSVDTLDWTQPGVGAMVQSVQRLMHPGAVILFHDGGGPREQTVEAVRVLIPWLQQQGYEFTFPT